MAYLSYRELWRAVGYTFPDGSKVVGAKHHDGYAPSMFWIRPAGETLGGRDYAMTETALAALVAAGESPAVVSASSVRSS